MVSVDPECGILLGIPMEFSQAHGLRRVPVLLVDPAAGAHRHRATASDPQPLCLSATCHREPLGAKGAAMKPLVMAGRWLEDGWK